MNLFCNFSPLCAIPAYLIMLRTIVMKIDSNPTFLDYANSKIEIKVKAIESNQEDGSKPFLHMYLKTFYLFRNLSNPVVILYHLICT